MKNVLHVLIILAYIILIGAMIVNNGYFIFKEDWLLILNIVLLSIGLYNFVNNNNNK